MATDPSSARSAAPPRDEVVVDPKYRVDQVDRTMPAQVAWAYVTLLYTHAATDYPGQSATRAECAAVRRASVEATRFVREGGTVWQAGEREGDSAGLPEDTRRT